MSMHANFSWWTPAKMGSNLQKKDNNHEVRVPVSIGLSGLSIYTTPPPPLDWVQVHHRCPTPTFTSMLVLLTDWCYI